MIGGFFYRQSEVGLKLNRKVHEKELLHHYCCSMWNELYHHCLCAVQNRWKKINVNKVVQAGTDAVKAISLSDADIAAMSKEYMEWMDTHNPLTKPDTDYGKRLEKLTGNIKEVDGLKVNFGVYEVIDVNAFACGDGSVRICAGLMDIMTDDEVMAVVGHEIGHVILRIPKMR